MVEESTDIAVVETKPTAIKLTDTAIEAITDNIMQAEKLISQVLEREIDYGRLPGTPQDGLWDPGASKIMNAFNCYSVPEVIHHIEEDGLISFTILSKVFSRETQQIVGTGIGAASTREPKYKYRWVSSPDDFGYSPEQIKTLKFKDGKYRIENPEYGELVNTMVKMACKRAEVDAAQSLPGVSSTLRKLFQGKQGKPLKEEGPNWPTFWGQVDSMGLTEAHAYEMLGITSLQKDWLAKGKSLNLAIQTLSSKLTEKGQKATKTAAPPSAKRIPDDIQPADVSNATELIKVAHELWGLQPKEVWAELNYADQKNFEDAQVEEAADCFMRLKAKREKHPDEGLYD